MESDKECLVDSRIDYSRIDEFGRTREQRIEYLKTGMKLAGSSFVVGIFWGGVAVYLMMSH